MPQKKVKGPDDESLKSAKQTLFSMMFSLILVALSLLFVFGFRIFLKHHTYKGPEISIDSHGEDQADTYIEDKNYTPGYIMVINVNTEDFYANQEPGVKSEQSLVLKNGDIIETTRRGTYNGALYYETKSGLYVEGDTQHVKEVSEYIPLQGYIVITYMSASGIRLRSWVDFNTTDNIVETVYVGDAVEIKAMVSMIDGQSALQTTEGYYVTTDTRYFTDCTNMEDVMKPAEAASTETLDSSEASTELVDSSEATTLTQQ